MLELLIHLIQCIVTGHMLTYVSYSISLLCFKHTWMHIIYAPNACYVIIIELNIV